MILGILRLLYWCFVMVLLLYRLARAVAWTIEKNGGLNELLWVLLRVLITVCFLYSWYLVSVPT